LATAKEIESAAKMTMNQLERRKLLGAGRTALFLLLRRLIGALVDDLRDLMATIIHVTRSKKNRPPKSGAI
jgi:hypothetical protein